VIDARRDGPDRVIIGLLVAVQVNEEIDPVVPDIHRRRGMAILDPVHSRDILGAGVLDLKARRQQIGDHHIIDIRAIALLQGQLAQ